MSRPLVWIDLEMTGLDALKDEVIEVAMVITDQDLNAKVRYDNVVNFGDRTPDVLAKMNDFVREMHTKSGLVAAIERRAGVPLCDIEDMLCAKIEAEGATTNPKEQAILAGSSVHKDREFIRAYMPKLDALLHYRLLDVSAFKVAFPYIFRNVSSGEGHRAASDIQDSIDILKKMKGHVSI